MRTLSRATATSSCTQSRVWWISAPSSTTSNSRVFLSFSIHPQHSISFRSASKCTRCIPFSPLSNSPTRPSFSSSSSKATTTCTASLSSASRPPTRSRPSARCSTTPAHFTAATRASSTPITTPRSTRSSPSKKYRLLFPSFLVLQQRGEVRHQQLSRLPFFPLLRLAHLSPAQHRRVRRLSQHAGQPLLLQRLPLPLRPLRLPPYLPLGRQHGRPSAVHHQTRHHRLCPSFSLPSHTGLRRDRFSLHFGSAGARSLLLHRLPLPATPKVPRNPRQTRLRAPGSFGGLLGVQAAIAVAFPLRCLHVRLLLFLHDRVLTMCLPPRSSQGSWRLLLSLLAAAFACHSRVHSIHKQRDCIVPIPVRKDVVMMFDMLSVELCVLDDT